MRREVSACTERRDVYEVAAAADVDHRTVLRYLSGEIAQRNSNARSKIIHAMRELGYDVPPTRKHPKPAPRRSEA